MTRYNKFWLALLGAGGVGLSSFGVLSEPESQAVVTSLVGLGTALGVWAVPNGR